MLFLVTCLIFFTLCFPLQKGVSINNLDHYLISLTVYFWDAQLRIEENICILSLISPVTRKYLINNSRPSSGPVRQIGRVNHRSLLTLNKTNLGPDGKTEINLYIEQAGASEGRIYIRGWYFS